MLHLILGMMQGIPLPTDAVGSGVAFQVCLPQELAGRGCDQRSQGCHRLLATPTGV